MASSDSSPSSSEVEPSPGGAGGAAPPPVMAAMAAVSGWSCQCSGGGDKRQGVGPHGFGGFFGEFSVNLGNFLGVWGIFERFLGNLGDSG